MSFLSSINPAKVALEATTAVMTGGGSLVAQAALRVFSSVGQSVLQNVGQHLGLPQSDIDMAKATFAATSGDVEGAATNTQAAVSDFVQAAGGGYGDLHSLNSSAQQVTKQLVDAANDAASGADSSDGSKAGKGKGAAAPQDFLEALAQALGKAIDDKMGQMMTTAQDIDKQTESANASGGSKSPVISEMSAKLQALGQEVSLLSSALDNSIKSIGEASSTLAKKD